MTEGPEYFHLGKMEYYSLMWFAWFLGAAPFSLVGYMLGKFL